MSKKWPKFVFVGDSEHEDPNNPRYISIFGYTFELNGEPVKVKPSLKDKLSNHSHFEERQ